MEHGGSFYQPAGRPSSGCRTFGPEAEPQSANDHYHGWSADRVLPPRATLLRVAVELRRHQSAGGGRDAARSRARHAEGDHDQHLHARRQPRPQGVRR